MIEEQINDMKCPQNCIHGNISVWNEEIEIECEIETTLHEDNWTEFCKKCKQWRLQP